MMSRLDIKESIEFCFDRICSSPVWPIEYPAKCGDNRFPFHHIVFL